MSEMPERSEMSMQELIDYMPGYDWIMPEDEVEEPPEPELQKPYCRLCGAEMELDDTACWNCEA